MGIPLEWAWFESNFALYCMSSIFQQCMLPSSFNSRSLNFYFHQKMTFFAKTQPFLFKVLLFLLEEVIFCWNEINFPAFVMIIQLQNLCHERGNLLDLRKEVLKKKLSMISKLVLKIIAITKKIISGNLLWKLVLGNRKC